jgi:hypothetical protein
LSRRKHRRRRRDREAKAVAPIVVAEERPVNWSRLCQVFGNLSHRGTKIFPNHVLAPVVVDAASPEEMVAETERAIVEETKEQRPS